MSGRRLISSGSPFEVEIGYSRAVVDGDMCFVAGTTGYDYSRMELPDDVAEQARNAIGTVARTLAEAGFGLSDVVSVIYILTDRADVGHVVPVLGEAFGGIRPAAAMMIAELMQPEMKFEIMATAKRSR